MSKKSKRQISYGSKNSTGILNRDEFNPDYSNTKRELKRIGILAGSFIALLVLLSFFQDSILKLFIK